MGIFLLRRAKRKRQHLADPKLERVLTMPSGGRRANAGRRPILSEWQRLCIGVDCEHLWGEAGKDKIKSMQRAFEAAGELTTEQSEFKRNYVAQRGNISPTDYDAYQQAISDSIWIGAGRSALELDQLPRSPRMLRFVTSRPYGQRAEIIERVRREWSEAIGRRLSASIVKKCWEYHRAQLNQ
ncbi:hypothetical protein [Caulobacter sp. HMWF025]|uniref:hypothetical protein n=1 Tax=Caulobacter sp. HMWF025 TaxID=2056860 RepID=UPI0011B29B9A|nr:hypothetical protein [Caulobacter sp. HMWF025]